MFHTGDITQVIYGYGPHPDDPERSQEISENALFMQHVGQGLVEVLFTDGKMLMCSSTRLKMRCMVGDPAYSTLKVELFPDSLPQAA